MNRNIAIVLIIITFASGTYVSASTVSAEQGGPFAEIKMYENQEYGFTIEYPSGWILNDSIPQKNKWIEIVSFLPDSKDWSQGIYVNRWEGDLKDKNFDSNEYLENHNKAAQDWCSSLSISENGFACLNYSLIEQKTVSISGRNSFLLEENWTRIEGETSSEVLVYNLQIPDGEDRWTIIAESRKEILNKTINILKNSLDSFTLLNELQNSSGIEKISPLKQYEQGVKRDDVRCNHGLELLLKYDNSPACIKPDSFLKLVERGWTKIKVGEIISIFPEYEIVNGEVSSIRHFDSGIYCDKYIQIFLDSQDTGNLRIEIGRDQLDAKITEVVDDDFFILVDKKEVDFEEIKTTEISRTLEISFPKGTKIIDILPSCPL